MKTLKHCASFYVFKESVHITDITEDKYRADKDLVSRKDLRRFPDESLIDVWKLCDGDLSKVGINGQDVYRPDLRSSVSIRDRFTVNKVSFLGKLFSKVQIGVGSKHIYVAKDFMRKHRDTRLPDLDGLPHVMTMVVFASSYDASGCYYSGGKLLINDVDVIEAYSRVNKDTNDYYSDDGYSSYGNQIVLFPITSIHEVTEITQGERHTFVFPVYGHFDPFSRIVKNVGNNSKYTTVYDEILEDLNSMVDSTDTDRAHFLGKLEVLEDESICAKFVRFRNSHGDYVPHEHSHGVNQDNSDSELPEFITRITYELDGKPVMVNSNSYVALPVGATNVVINGPAITTSDTSDNHLADTEKLPRLLAEIRDKVIYLKRNFEETIIANIEMTKQEECKLTASDLPKEAFAYVAKNMYFSDTSVRDLRGVDAYIYQLALESKRKLHLVFTNLKEFTSGNSVVPVYYLNSTTSTLVPISRANLPQSDYITAIYTEHDDQGGYDPRYSRLHCTVFIGHIDDAIA